MDEALQARMLAIFPPASAAQQQEQQQAAGDGQGGGSPRRRLPTLHAVIVELDGRFITELTHTAALFSELFEAAGRKRLVKVGGRWGGGGWGRSLTGQGAALRGGR